MFPNLKDELCTRTRNHSEGQWNFLTVTSPTRERGGHPATVGALLGPQWMGWMSMFTVSLRESHSWNLRGA